MRLIKTKAGYDWLRFTFFSKNSDLYRTDLLKNFQFIMTFALFIGKMIFLYLNHRGHVGNIVGYHKRASHDERNFVDFESFLCREASADAPLPTTPRVLPPRRTERVRQVLLLRGRKVQHDHVPGRARV